MKNKGKIFEEDFKHSVPKYCWLYRLKDGSANIGNVVNNKVRFQCHNIADYIMFSNKYLYILELKSHAGKSFPFTCIRSTQIKEMNEIKHEKIKTFFLFNFRDEEKTFAIEAKKIKAFMENSNRKSIPYEWCEKEGILIGCKLKKVRYRYDINSFICFVENINENKY